MEIILCVEAIWSPVLGMILNVDSADVDLRSTFTASEAPRCGDRLWDQWTLGNPKRVQTDGGERVKVPQGLRLHCEHGDV